MSSVCYFLRYFITIVSYFVAVCRLVAVKHDVASLESYAMKGHTSFDIDMVGPSFRWKVISTVVNCVGYAFLVSITLGLRQNSHHFVDINKCIFCNAKI